MVDCEMIRMTRAQLLLRWLRNIAQVRTVKDQFSGKIIAVFE